MQQIKVNSIYQHWKGNLYQIVGIAKDAETLEDIVVYRSLDNNQIWVRSLANFTEILGDKDSEGTCYYRFSLVDISSVAWSCLLQSLTQNCDIHILIDELLEELDTSTVTISRTVRNTCMYFELLKNVAVSIRSAANHRHLSSGEFYSVDQWFDGYKEEEFPPYITVRIIQNNETI